MFPARLICGVLPPLEASGAAESVFEPDTRVMAALGRATSAVDYVRAVEGRHAHVRRHNLGVDRRRGLEVGRALGPFHRGLVDFGAGRRGLDRP